MYESKLRKVGGSIMLTLPPVILDTLKLREGGTVGLALDGGRLIVDPQTKPRYTLDELLAQYDETVPLSESVQTQDRDWLDIVPFGREL